jgi:hypothetical protein
MHNTNLTRRQMLAGTAAIAVAGPAQAITVQPDMGGDAALLSLFDAMFAEGIADSPERATALGLDKGPRRQPVGAAACHRCRHTLAGARAGPGRGGV